MTRQPYLHLTHYTSGPRQRCITVPVGHKTHSVEDSRALVCTPQLWAKGQHTISQPVWCLHPYLHFPRERLHVPALWALFRNLQQRVICIMKLRLCLSLLPQGGGERVGMRAGDNFDILICCLAVSSLSTQRWTRHTHSSQALYDRIARRQRKYPHPEAG